MTSNQRRSRIVGTLRHIGDGKGAVRMEDTYGTDIDDLWSALTDPDRLGRWLADVKGDLRLGGQIHARFTSTWDGPGRIDVCEAPHHLLVTMDPGTPDETVIEATLVSEQDQTRLVIEERGIPVAEIAAHGAGWQAHVDDLTAHIQGQEPGNWRNRLAELKPAYEDLAARLA